MSLARKDWNDHVAHAEEVARGRGFQGLRDEILEGAGATPEDVVVDVGSGTGLLTLALAPRVRRVWAVDIARSAHRAERCAGRPRPRRAAGALRVVA